MKIKAYKLIRGGLKDRVYEIHIDNIDSMSNYHLVRNKK